MGAEPNPATWVGPKLARLKAKLIILPLYAAASTKKKNATQGGESCLAWGSRTCWGCLAGGLGGFGWGDGGRWQRKQKKKKKTGGAAERRGKPTVALDDRLVVMLASCGGADGGKTGDEGGGGGWRPQWWGKKSEDCAGKKTGEEAGLFWFFDPIFSSFRPSNPPVFIGDGRGQSCLHCDKISALDLVRKDPNRWFKGGNVHCQICRKRLPELTCLGRRRRCHVAIKTEMFTWRCRGTAGDHLCAIFVKFDGR